MIFGDVWEEIDFLKGLGTDHYFSGGGGGGGMKNIEKNCLQGLKRQNKLFANIICIKKIVCIEVRETFFQFNFLIF